VHHRRADRRLRCMARNTQFRAELAVSRWRPSDVTFLTNLVSDLAGPYFTNVRPVPDRVSGGGRIASRLACDASGSFTAAAPVPALRLPALPGQPGRAGNRLARHRGPDRPDQRARRAILRVGCEPVRTANPMHGKPE
jgi:poly(3-hydroxybutyrate) depolymerase